MKGKDKTKDSTIRSNEDSAELKSKIKILEEQIAIHEKKEIALREEQEKARLKAKKQRSSKNSEKKDIH